MFRRSETIVYFFSSKVLVVGFTAVTGALYNYLILSCFFTFEVSSDSLGLLTSGDLVRFYFGRSPSTMIFDLIGL